MNDAPAAGEGAAEPPRIGPNAITRTQEALVERLGDHVVDAVFRSAGLASYLAAMPTTMVPEAEVVALHRALRQEVEPAAADAVMRDAGERTARYLLAHRIPKPAQALFGALPAPLAARLLSSLIARHAWTFAGSARVTFVPGPPVLVHFEGSPFARVDQAAGPVCGFYTGTFEALFRALVHPRTEGKETACMAAGAACCTLSLDWRR